MRASDAAALLGRNKKLRLSLLGKMRAEFGGKDLLPRNRKTRAMLAILAIANGEPVSRQRLTDLLWSGRDGGLARGSFRQSLYDLQERLHDHAPNILIVDRLQLALNMEQIELDIECVVHQPVSPDAVLAMLDAGTLAAQSRDLLEELVGIDEGFMAWLVQTRQTLIDRATAVAEDALAAARANVAVLGPGQVADAAVRLLRLAPSREDVWRELMAANLATGDHDSAARNFERCAAALARAGVAPPSEETRALAKQVHAIQDAAADPPMPALAPMPHAAPLVRVDVAAMRLGVLPFRPIGTANHDEIDWSLCVGLAEEITTALARFRGIMLIASSSVLASRPRGGLDAADGSSPSDALARLRALRLDFMLDGTVQRSGARVRVTVRLLDMRGADGGGEMVWSRRFDRLSDDLLALQDEVASETVAQVDPEMMLRGAYPPGTSQTQLHATTANAHELVLRSIPALYRIEREEFGHAGDLLQAALAHSPDYAAANAWSAYWNLFLVGQGWATDPSIAIARAGRFADRAVSLDPGDARGLTIAGHVRAFLRRNIHEAMALHERALELNPNLPLAWALSGLCQCYAGQHEIAVQQIDQARKLSPFDPHRYFFDMALSMPLLLQGRFVEALQASRRAAALNPTLSSSYKGYLAALGSLGSEGSDEEREDLASVHRQLVSLEPEFTLAAARSRSPLRREEDLKIYLDGLRRGGLREA